MPRVVVTRNSPCIVALHGKDGGLLKAHDVTCTVALVLHCAARLCRLCMRHPYPPPIHSGRSSHGATRSPAVPTPDALFGKLNRNAKKTAMQLPPPAGHQSQAAPTAPGHPDCTAVPAPSGAPSTARPTRASLALRAKLKIFFSLTARPDNPVPDKSTPY